MAETTLKAGMLVEGTVPATGKKVVGWLRGPHPHNRTNQLWCIDNPKWDGDPEHMPRHQSLCREETIRPLEGQRLEDTMIEAYAKQVLDGATSRDDAVRAIARDTKTSQTKVGEKLDAAIAAEKAERRAHAPATRSPKQAAEPKGKAEHAEPRLFAELRDSLGMSNKDCAAAQEAAGLGSTLSRVTELTHSKGASMAMFEKVKEAWTQWRAANPARVVEEE